MAQIKPFHFRLGLVSKAQTKIVDALLEFLPATGVREKFHLAIRKALHKYLPEIRYYLEAIETPSFCDFYAALPSPCCVGSLSMEPFKEKAFVEIDLVLSCLIIEKLLGGSGEELVELRFLTETEQGVIEFLLMKILSEIDKLCGKEAKLHFRLEQIVLEPARLRSLQREDLGMVCLKIHAALLKRSGFIKIYLPNPWISEGFLKDLPGDKKSALHEELKKGLSHFESMDLELWGALGGSSVPYGDFKSLEEGDVVLFDETGLVRKKEGWQGEIKLHVGTGEAGGLRASWKGFGEGGACRLSGPLSGGKIYG